MENLLTVAFEAHHPVLNHHRHYQVVIGRDLLNDWTVVIRFGRLGQRGRELRFGSPSSEDMRKVIHDRVRRRLSAPKRIGCPYRLTVFSAAPGFDTASWLPRSLITRFFRDHPVQTKKADCRSR
jgi:WGR domain